MNAARNVVKMMDPNIEIINENTFYIYPFGAMKSANLSGEITALLTPLIASLAPALASDKKLMDLDVNDIAPQIGKAFGALSGDMIEGLIRKLILDNNVGVLKTGADDAVWLTEQVADEVFCTNAQDMFILAFYVIKANYSGFFAKFGNLSGSHLMKMMNQKFPDMESLMPTDSVT